MADSWEDAAHQGSSNSNPNNNQNPPLPQLNPTAASFSFNPASSSFVPPGGGYGQQPPPPPQYYQQQQQQMHPQQMYQQQYQQQQPQHYQQHQQQYAPQQHHAPQYHQPMMGVDSGAAAAAAAAAASHLAAMNVNSQGAAVPTHAPAPAHTPPNPAAPKNPAAAAAAPKPKPPAPKKPAAPPSPPPPAPAAPEPEPEEDAIDEEAAAAEAAATLALLDAEDPRDHLNVVFIGHVDAGKSTTGGQILFLTGGVDDRTIAKYEKEAKDKNRESWYMAYIMDTNEEERAKGKTVEVGRAHFSTDSRRYTILDAPGHKNYVPNMIAGAAQADVGVLVIAARKGEFETGFERGGQTREHAQLAKTLGVAKLVVAVNKMDDPSVVEEDGSWSQSRYDEVLSGLTPFLKACGYNTKRDVVFLPMSGLHGHNIKDSPPSKICPWYKGPTLFGVLDSVEMPARDPLAPFRLSIIDKYRDMGTIVMGKSEAGLVKKGDRLLLMPNRSPVTVAAIHRDDVEVSAARGGENLRLRLSGVDEDEVQAGFVLCSRRAPVPCVTYFDAQLQILDLLEHKAIFTAGYKAVLHVHSLVEECEITALLARIDMKTREKVKAKFVKSGAVCIARVAVEKPICVELFDQVPQLGRFTLRDEGRTIAIGKIIRVPKRQGAAVASAAAAAASAPAAALSVAPVASDDGGAAQ